MSIDLGSDAFASAFSNELALALRDIRGESQRTRQERPTRNRKARKSTHGSTQPPHHLQLTGIAVRVKPKTAEAGIPCLRVSVATRWYATSLFCAVQQRDTRGREGFPRQKNKCHSSSFEPSPLGTSRTRSNSPCSREEFLHRVDRKDALLGLRPRFKSNDFALRSGCTGVFGL